MDFTIDQLRRYLLGGVYDGPGLIRRVEQRVDHLSTAVGPKFRARWYIPTQGSAHDMAEESGQVERLTDLCVALVEWEGRGIGTSAGASERALRKYLRDNHITDVGYLLGLSDAELPQIPEDDRARLRFGKLKSIYRQVEDLLRSDVPTEQQVHRCVSLTEWLVAWLGGCRHDFEPMASDDSRIQVLRCHCGAGFSRWADEDERLAVGG